MGNRKNKMTKIKRALISTWNKSNLKNLLKLLKKEKVELISSGGTYKEIRKLGFKCIKVSSFTGSTEILNGRVKTLHPKIHAGILSKRNNRSHKKDLKKNNFLEIDLVIVNFYPFEKTLENTKNHNIIFENIDIGGPAMVRAAAKNYKDVTVITNPNQYKDLIEELVKNKGSTSLSFRQKHSREAFVETAYYDSLIANYLNNSFGEKFPNKKVLFGNLIEKLRYGENPHQESAVYSFSKNIKIEQLSGKKLSYNNYNDMFSALSISKTLPTNKGTVIIKHTNPCGVSINKDHLKSYQYALACDPLSAFGGILSCNYKVKIKLAKEINKLFFEVVIANGFAKDALKILKSKKNLRIIDARKIKINDIQNFITNFNMILVQNSDTNQFSNKNFKVVSKKKPNSKTLKSLIFAFNICRFVKSNSIVLVKKDTTVGIGGGQPSRVDSCQIAINKMNNFQKISENDEIVAASDAFFPFVDGFEKLVQAGVSAIIQPSGSIRDKEIIKFANETKTILVFSKTRHLKH